MCVSVPLSHCDAENLGQTWQCSRFYNFILFLFFYIYQWKEDTQSISDVSILKGVMPLSVRGIKLFNSNSVERNVCMTSAQSVCGALMSSLMDSS